MHARHLIATIPAARKWQTVQAFFRRIAQHAQFRSGLAALLVILCTPLAGRAQTAATATDRTATRAHALHEQAASLFESPTRYRDAALLLRQAAALRESLDERGTEELLLAGRLSYYATDWRTAQSTLEEGADRSLENGQLAQAAHAYIDAAFSALARRDRRATNALVRRAERLAGSPHLQPAERDKIMVRIRPVRVALAADGGV